MGAVQGIQTSMLCFGTYELNPDNAPAITGQERLTMTTQTGGQSVPRSSRYSFETGLFGTLTLTHFMSGTQSEDNVPDAVKKLFTGSDMKIKSVAVIYEGVTGDDKVDIWHGIDG